MYQWHLWHLVRERAPFSTLFLLNRIWQLQQLFIYHWEWHLLHATTVGYSVGVSRSPPQMHFKSSNFFFGPVFVWFTGTNISPVTAVFLPQSEIDLIYTIHQFTFQWRVIKDIDKSKKI
jgi:hypothetical protein